MSNHADNSNSSNRRHRVENYHFLFEHGLELIRQNQMPDEEILQLLKKYSEKLDAGALARINQDLVNKIHPVVLLAIQEKLLSDNQELLQIKEGYEQVLNLLTHEFKNLLTTAQGYNLLLGKGLLEQNQSELLDLHHSNDRVINKLFHMIDALLKMSLNERRLLQPDYRLIDFERDVLLPLESELDHEFDLKCMQIVKKIQAKKTMIMADEQLLEIIMRNLLENAVKYGDNDSKIELILKNDRKNLIVSIKNFCRHLPPNICKEIFSKYKSVKMSHIQTGTGLGLYNVKSLLNLQGGNISCQSVTKKWIKFTFSIPFEPEKESV